MLGVVLTGMGADGARGSAEIVRAGGSVVVQDEATSVVWGMPGSVAAAGLASQQLPLREVASAILTRSFSRQRNSLHAKAGYPTSKARPKTLAPTTLNNQSVSV